MTVFLKRLLGIRDKLRKIYWQLRAPARPKTGFGGSERYWETRYHQGGTSGVGSYGKFAAFKAEVLNEFVRKHRLRSVIEHGCGDGNQLKLCQYPSYLGLDVSPTAIATCRSMFAGDTSKSFKLSSEYAGEIADLALSLDVLYHLVENDLFESYMRRLFDSSSRYVIIYSSNTDDNSDRAGAHVKHRQFSDWVATRLREWELVQHIPNRYPYRGDYRQGSFADFYIYERTLNARKGP